MSSCNFHCSDPAWHGSVVGGWLIMRAKIEVIRLSEIDEHTSILGWRFNDIEAHERNEQRIKR